MRGHAGSERSSQCRLLLLDLRLGLALGRLVCSGVGSSVDGFVGFGRGCVFGRRRLGLRLARRIDLGTVDLDETDVTSVDSRLAAGSPACSPWCGCTDRSSCRSDGRRSGPYGPLDGLDAPASQMLGFRGGDDDVEVPILRFIDRPGQCCDRAREERVASLRGDVLHTIEIADAAGDQLVLLDRSQFGPVDQFGLEQSRLEDAAA